MANKYFLVQKEDFKEEYIAFSNDPDLVESQLPVRTYNSVDYYVFEVSEENILKSGFKDLISFKDSATVKNANPPKTTHLMISDEIPASSEEFVEMTPESGRVVKIKKFETSGAYNQNLVARLVWKINHASEEEVVLWTSKGDQVIEPSIRIDSSEVDGVRKLGLVLENSLLVGSVYLSAHVFVEEC